MPLKVKAVSEEKVDEIVDKGHVEGEITNKHPYSEEYEHIAWQASINGYSKKKLAALLGVPLEVVESWYLTQKDFRKAYDYGSEHLATKATAKLAELAMGAKEVTKQIVQEDGCETKVITTVKQLAPNIRALETIVKTTNPTKWRENVDNSQSQQTLNINNFYGDKSDAEQIKNILLKRNQGKND